MSMLSPHDLVSARRLDGGEVPAVDIIMTNPTPTASTAHWRLRVPAGACGVTRLDDNLSRLHGTGAPVFGYTPAIVDVVQGDFPGVPAWSPPVY